MTDATSTTMQTIAAKAAPGAVALLGGFSLEDVSHLAAALSYGAGAVWFATQTYFLWRDKHRNRKD